nr:unnamed protein product [Callosobruchus chinensis]
MILLVVSSCLSFLSIHSSWVGSQVLKLVNRPTSKQRQLLSKKRDLQLEQSSINMADHFVQYSRIQRKINAIDEELTLDLDKKNNWELKLGLAYGARILFGIILIILSLYYRHTPLFIVDNNLDLSPFNYIISYPNGNNTVTVHFWIMCCTATFRLLKF